MTETIIDGKQAYYSDGSWGFVTDAGKARIACTYCLVNSFKLRVARWQVRSLTYDHADLCKKHAEHFARATDWDSVEIAPFLYKLSYA